MKTLKQNRKLLMVAYLAAIGITLIVVNTGITKEIRDNLDIALPINDKIAHFFLMGSLAYLLPFALLDPSKARFRWNFVGLVALIAFLVTAEEFSQRFLLTRSFQLWDLVADYLGILCFSAFYWLQHAKSIRNEQYK